MQCIISVTDSAGPVAVSLSEDNGNSISGTDVTTSFVTSGNGGSDVSNLPSPNNSEEPLPSELWSTPILVQVSVLHTNTHTYTHTHMHTRMHTHKYTHAYTHTHTIVYPQHVYMDVQMHGE